MLLIVNNEDQYRSAQAALEVIHNMSVSTYASRPIMEDSPWVKTVWPSEQYL